MSGLPIAAVAKDPTVVDRYKLVDSPIPEGSQVRWAEIALKSAIPVIKSTEKFSSIERKDGQTAKIYVVSLVNNTVYYDTDRFILTTIQQAKSERVQVTDTFDENAPSINFFGKKTAMYAFGGVLINTTVNKTEKNGDTEASWVQKFQHAWDNYLRASVLSKTNSIAMMVVDNEYYQGYPITQSVNKQSVSDETANFSMSWIILNHGTLLNEIDLEDTVKNKALSDQMGYIKNSEIINSLLMPFYRIKLFSLNTGNKVTLDIGKYKNSSYYDPVLGKQQPVTSYDKTKTTFTKDVITMLNSLVTIVGASDKVKTESISIKELAGLSSDKAVDVSPDLLRKMEKVQSYYAKLARM